MLRKRNSFPAAVNDLDANGAAKRDKKDDDDEEINVVDLSDSELDDDQEPQSSKCFSISNPEVLKQLSVVRFRDNSCRPLDLSKKALQASPSSSDASSTAKFENGGTKLKNTWPLTNFAERSASSSPLVLNQVRPSVIRSVDLCFDHQELPDVDEHFRKSLGSQAPPNEADAKVDDHFARALGQMWWQLKKQDTNGSSDGIVDAQSSSTRSSSSR